jgi:hypothetical protein
MSENTVTKPGHVVIIKTATPTTDGRPTSHTTVTDFTQVKHLLSEKPLRPPVRQQHR